VVGKATAAHSFAFRLSLTFEFLFAIRLCSFCFKAKDRFSNVESDFLSNLQIVGAFEFARSKGQSLNFCYNNFLRSKQMFEIEEMRKQLISIVLRIRSNESPEQQQKLEDLLRCLFCQFVFAAALLRTLMEPLTVEC
jgi:hypothetical protein